VREQRIVFTARPSISDDLKFRHPFSCIVSEPRGSGKSSFVIRFLQNLHHLCTVPTFAGGIVWCYGEKSDVPSRNQLPGYVRINEGVAENFGSANGESNLVILDDLLTDVYSNKCVNCLREVAITGI